MATALNKTKLNNLANEIWKSAERLRGNYKRLVDHWFLYDNAGRVPVLLEKGTKR